MHMIGETVKLGEIVKLPQKSIEIRMDKGNKCKEGGF